VDELPVTRPHSSDLCETAIAGGRYSWRMIRKDRKTKLIVSI
jgi:hypothetical protein